MSERILIIEDETAIRSILSELLADAGYSIETAGDGLEGITKFREKPFDLILLDIMMPKIDGYTVCEMIRRDSNVPVIMLTALDEEEAQIRAFELKADDYIIKPFSVKLVLMRLEAVLRRAKERKSQVAAATLSYENIRMNRESHSVSVGEIRSLSPIRNMGFWNCSCAIRDGYLRGIICSIRCGAIILSAKKKPSISTS